MSTNDAYELIGGLLYETPVDETSNSIKSVDFIKARDIVNGLLTITNINTEKKLFNKLIDSFDIRLVNYINSPLIDFLFQHGGTVLCLLEHAIDDSNLNAIIYLHTRGANLRDRDDYLLRIPAPKIGNLDIIKYIVKAGGNIHAGSEHALRNAAKHGHLDVVKYLVECGADVNAERDSAFVNAIERGHYDVVEYLIENYSDTLTLISRASTLYNASYVAIKHGYFKIVKFLMENVIAMNDLNYALYEACVWNQPELVKYFIERGANFQFHRGRPLEIAIEYGHIGIVDYLMSLYPKDFNIREKALEIATTYDIKKVIDHLNKL